MSKDDTPVFDFSNYSYGDQQEEFMLRIQRQRLAKKLDAPIILSDEEFQATFNEYQRLDAAIETFFCAHIVSVPRAWLVKDAPSALDWKDPASLRWVRADRVADLREAGADARSPESVSGN